MHVCPTGGRLSGSDGEGLSSADLPSQPTLSVEETRPAQAETPGLVSVSLCVCVRVYTPACVHARSVPLMCHQLLPLWMPRKNSL